jgi:hypothetical protein
MSDGAYAAWMFGSIACFIFFIGFMFGHFV